MKKKVTLLAGAVAVLFFTAPSFAQTASETTKKVINTIGTKKIDGKAGSADAAGIGYGPGSNGAFTTGATTAATGYEGASLTWRPGFGAGNGNTEQGAFGSSAGTYGSSAVFQK